MKVFRRTIKKKKKHSDHTQDNAGKAALERRVEDEDLPVRKDPDDYDDYDDDYEGRMRRDDEDAAGCYFQELDSPEREEHPNKKWRENTGPSDGGLPLVISDNLVVDNVANGVVMKRPLCRLAQLPSSQPSRQTYQKLSQRGHKPACQKQPLGVSAVAASAAECSDNNAGSDASDVWQRQPPGVSAVASKCGEVHGGYSTADIWKKRPPGVSAPPAEAECSLVDAGSESKDIWQKRPPGVSVTAAAAERSLVNAGNESTDVWQKRPPGVSAVAATDHIDTGSGSTVFPAFRRGQKIQVWKIIPCC